MVTNSPRRKIVSATVQLLGHSVGVAVVYSLSFWPMGPEGVKLLGEASAVGAMETMTSTLFLQVALSACIWALGFIAVRLSQLAWQSREKTTRTVKLSRGVVLTETLIVFPIFLLLTLGLTQLTLNNTAAILTGLAAFQAGRTVHIWSPETDSAVARNGGISKADAEERARVAAASVLAPMQPTSYADGCSTSQLIETKIEAVLSVSLGVGGSFGFSSAGAVKAAAGARDLSHQRNLTMASGFDSSRFEIRGPLKLLGAYCNTTANYFESSALSEVNGVGGHAVAVAFDHKQTMPLVGRIFGDVVKPTGRFSRIERTYQIPAQIPPNSVTPTSVLAFLPGQISNPFDAWFK